MIVKNREILRMPIKFYEMRTKNTKSKKFIIQYQLSYLLQYFLQSSRQCSTASYKNMKIIIMLVQLLIAVKRQLNRKRLTRYQIKHCYPNIQKAFVKYD